MVLIFCKAENVPGLVIVAVGALVLMVMVYTLCVTVLHNKIINAHLQNADHQGSGLVSQEQKAKKDHVAGAMMGSTSSSSLKTEARTASGGLSSSSPMKGAVSSSSAGLLQQIGLGATLAEDSGNNFAEQAMVNAIAQQVLRESEKADARTQKY